MADKILSSIRAELKEKYDPVYKQGAIKFFKERINPHGVRTADARKIAKEYFKQIKDLPKENVFLLCEKLANSDYFEEIGIAFCWAFNLRKQFEKKDFRRFERWIRLYVRNWANCDVFCGGAIGYFLLRFPQFLPELKKWAKSKNRWFRRAAAVSLIYPIREEGKYLDNIFEISDILLEDGDDLVQKGYGWLLKEASNVCQKEVFEYVMQRKEKMPRTSLRYAIEKMPKEMKRKAMEK